MLLDEFFSKNRFIINRFLEKKECFQFSKTQF
jgi:hypothetical protein